MLQVTNLTAGYGDIIAIRDFSFSVEPGSILALLGANGAGKTSALMSLFGLIERKSGIVSFYDEDISNLPVEKRIAKGMTIVPEGRRIFPDLSVYENLMVGGHIVPTDMMLEGIDAVFSYFPRLKERHKQAAGSLSGGEQQMLAMGRALISKPRLLIVDELSLGLMPKVVDECYAVINQLREQGLAIVLVEQNTERALKVANEVFIIEAGNLVWQGSAEEANNNHNLRENLLGGGSN